MSGSTSNTFGRCMTEQSPTGTGGKFSMATTDWLEAIFVDNGDSGLYGACVELCSTSVLVPYWFRLVVTSILSVLPWISWLLPFQPPHSANRHDARCRGAGVDRVDNALRHWSKAIP